MLPRIRPWKKRRLSSIVKCGSFIVLSEVEDEPIYEYVRYTGAIKNNQHCETTTDGQYILIKERCDDRGESQQVAVIG